MNDEALPTPRPRRPRLRWLRRSLGVLAGMLLALIVVVTLGGWRAFGKRADGPRRARMERSPQWKDGGFENPQPLVNSVAKMLTGLFDTSPDVSPRPGDPPAVVVPPAGHFDVPPTTGLRVTWFGHSTMLIEIDGRRVLTDPVWSDRASPLSWVGPTPWYSPPLALADLPRLDAVVISHDHYDHLDHRTIVALKDRDVKFVVPLGMGAHLAYWGVPEGRIVELDWWERTNFGGRGGMDIVCTPARHASGRMIVDDGAKLWAGFAFIGAAHRVYYSGDTGLFPAMREIGARLGPFDLTMIEVGQYGSGWPDWHIGPEQAVRAHGMVRGRVMLPVHWGKFQLAYHAWTEPVERTLAAAAAAGATVITPRPGQSIEPAAPHAFERWWPALPWRTGAQDPIVSSQMN